MHKHVVPLFFTRKQHAQKMSESSLLLNVANSDIIKSRKRRRAINNEDGDLNDVSSRNKRIPRNKLLASSPPSDSKPKVDTEIGLQSFISKK